MEDILYPVVTLDARVIGTFRPAGGRTKESRGWVGEQTEQQKMDGRMRHLGQAPLGLQLSGAIM